MITRKKSFLFLTIILITIGLNLLISHENNNFNRINKDFRDYQFNSAGIRDDVLLQYDLDWTYFVGDSDYKFFYITPDINGDGFDDILIYSAKTSSYPSENTITALTHRGELIWSVQDASLSYFINFYDGLNLRGQGNMDWDYFPYYEDKDLINDIVVTFTNTSDGIISGSSGNPIELIDILHNLGGGMFSSFLEDFTGDGNPEMIFVNDFNDFLVINSTDKMIIWSNAYEYELPILRTIPDVDGDGVWDVITGGYNHIEVQCWSGYNGSNIWNYTMSSGILDLDVCPDQDSDGFFDILITPSTIPMNNKLSLISGHNASSIWNASFTGESSTYYIDEEGYSYVMCDDDGMLRTLNLTDGTFINGTIELSSVKCLSGGNHQFLLNSFYKSKLFQLVNNFDNVSIYALGNYSTPVEVINGEWSLISQFHGTSSGILHDIILMNETHVVYYSHDLDRDGFSDNLELTLGTNYNGRWEYPKPDLNLSRTPQVSDNLVDIGVYNGGIWKAINVVVIIEIPSLNLELYNNTKDPFDLEVGEEKNISIDLTEHASKLKSGETYLMDVQLDPYNTLNETEEINNNLMEVDVSYIKPNMPTSGFNVVFLIAILLILGISGIVGGSMYHIWHQRRTDPSQKEGLYIKQKKFIDQKTSISDLIQRNEEDAPYIVEKWEGVKKTLHTCVVHGGAIKGVSFVCPYCKAMYCAPCAKKLMISEERCWSCNHDVRIYISQRFGPKLQERSTDQIIGDIINSHPIIKNYINSEITLEDIVELKNYDFSILREEDFDNLDLLSLPTNEKRRLIEELLWLDGTERDLLFKEMIERQGKKHE